MVFALGLLIGLLQTCAGWKRGIAIALCAFSMGALYAGSAFDVPLPAEGTYEISAYVSGGMRMRSDNRVSFTLSQVMLDGQPVEGKGYCSLHYAETPPELFDGAKVRFTGRVYHPDGPSGEPHFDFRMWMRQNGLAFGVAAYREVTVENTPASAPVMDAAYRVQQWFSHLYQRLMGENGRVAMALLFGDRSGLTDTEYRAFQELGIAHVMSVSGLHVALLGGLVVRLLQRARIRKGIRLLIVSVFLLAYCGVTGFSAAANRAAVMLILSMLASLCCRMPDRLTLLGGAMLAVLLINPLHAHSAGFVLSFCATLGITLYVPMVQRWWDRTPLERLPIGVRDAFAVTLTAQLGVTLPTIVYFHQLPLYGLAVNLLIVPLVSAVLVPLYALVIPFSFIPLAGPLIGRIASASTDVLLWLVSLLSRLPYASVRVGTPPAVLALALGLALVLLSSRLPGSLRRRALAALMVVMVGAAGACLQKPADLRYIQLSVGQADSALLLDESSTILIDAGVDGEAALDYLLYENRDVDALILTHLHVDHAGGAEMLLASGIDIHHVYLPAGAKEQYIDPVMLGLLERFSQENIPVTELASGDELRYNKADIQVLWPERETLRLHQDANLYPLVLSINLDGFRLLQTSDLEGVYERYCAVPADVLKVAHHGSSKSTGDAFLSFVDPTFALISASSGSRSLPGPDTLSRLESHGVSVFRTDECGDITLAVEDGQLTITPYKARLDP